MPEALTEYLDSLFAERGGGAAAFAAEIGQGIPATDPIAPANDNEMTAGMWHRFWTRIWPTWESE